LEDHNHSQKIRGLDNVSNYGDALGGIAVEQFLIAMATQKKLELPDQIPNVMQPGVHPLSTEGL